VRLTIHLLVNPYIRKGLSVRRQRPHGFKDYIAEQGFHTVYLVTTTRKSPVKVGIARDPVQRLGCLQSGHFEQLKFHRFWWLPGRPIAARIEREFKEYFAAAALRGEWFDVAPSKAEAFIADAIRTIGTWGIDQEEMARLMKQWELHQLERSLARISRGNLLARAQQVKWPVTRLAR
jgi:hypothetical protein